MEGITAISHAQMGILQGVGAIQVRYADGERERLGNYVVDF